MPGGDEISAVYPERAMRLERSGSVVLSCDVQPSGAVSGCTVVSETPVGLGFGEAAKRLEGSFRMKPTTPNGSPVGGSKVHIPVGFSLN